MDLYQNEEILTPCQEIENPDKRTICFYEMKIKQVRNHKSLLKAETGPEWFGVKFYFRKSQIGFK